MEENKVINEYENNKEAVEVRTVYVKEKERTGWWKIVMMVLAILMVICFGLTALFTGFGAAQLKTIAEKEPVQMPAPGSFAPGGEEIPDSGSEGKGIDDYTLGDLFQFFGVNPDSIYQTPSSEESSEAPDSGKEESAAQEPETSGTEENILDWFTGLFGEATPEITS